MASICGNIKVTSEKRIVNSEKGNRSVVGRLILAVLVIGLVPIKTKAQDIHLTQFYTAQQNLNPALAGQYDGAYRAAGNYRHQWPQINKAITTAMIAFDKKFFFYNDEIDAGILLINDNYSGFNLNTTKIFLTGSYKKMLKGHELRGGVQMGYVLKSTDLSSQTFPTQWDYQQGIFDTQVSNGETDLSESQSFFDMNLGFAWSHKFKKFKPTVGFSIFHITRPKDTYFSTQTERLRSRQVVHAEVDVPISDDFTVEPKFLYMWTTKVQDMIIGSNIKYHMDHPFFKNIYVGLLYRGGIGRNSDMITPVAGFHIKNFDIGLNYDVNVSALSANSSQKTTFEISIIYTAPLFAPKSLTIPCDRY